MSGDSQPPLIIPNTANSYRHAVAIPFPGRGHVNPLLNFCTYLTTTTKHRNLQPQLHFTFIVTEEWLELLNNPQHQFISFVTIPNNIIPSEHVRAYDHPGFLESVLRDMPKPVEQVLDKLDKRVDIIIADTFLAWPVSLGAKRGIPVASFFPMCGSMLSILYHRDLIDLSGGERRDEEEEEENSTIIITSIPGISSIKLQDVPAMLIRRSTAMERTSRAVAEAMEGLPKSQFLILRTMDELEHSAIEALRASLSPVGVPVYAIGPAIPYDSSSSLSKKDDDDEEEEDYIVWLNSQEERSVLYVALGSFVAVSKDQIDELGDGLKRSGKRVLWVARDDTDRFRNGGVTMTMMVVPWCDQMRVLSHPSIGGFLSHCGWNSTLESVFAGVPVLAWPLKADQSVNCKMMVDDWEIGWRLLMRKSKSDDGILVKSDEVCESVKRFMDLGSEERKVLDENARKLKEKVCGVMSDENGSTGSAVREFVESIGR